MNKRKGFVVVLSVIVAVFGCGVANGEAARICLRVLASKVDCADVPVCAKIELPEQFAQVPAEEIFVLLRERDKTDAAVPGQIVADEAGKTQLWWILPQAKANNPSDWIATLERRKNVGGEGFSWEEAPADHLDLLFDGRKVLRYMYACDTSDPNRAEQTNKPFHHIFDARGEKLLTNGPSPAPSGLRGAEGEPNILYPHHRGIFIGWSRVGFGGKDYDFWGMKGGSEVHRKFLERAAGPVLARSETLIDWNLKDGRTIISERRRSTVFRQGSPSIALVEFRIQLTAVNGDVLLDANKEPETHKAPEHGGFHFRAHNDVAEAGKDAKAAYLFHEEGIDPKKDKNLPWVAMSYGLNGKSYSIQHINHPDNPKPTVYSAHRDYGRFGAFFKQEIKAGQTLTLLYYIRAVEGKMPQRQELADKYSALVEAPVVEVISEERISQN